MSRALVVTLASLYLALTYYDNFVNLAVGLICEGPIYDMGKIASGAS